jgi:uncharacterized protein YhbP (UPF0306 family)
MNTRRDQKSVVRAILDANRYMTLATADEPGSPWASPVWYATEDYGELFWVSSPDARHSHNISVRPQVAIAIFDSRQAPLTGQGVYIAATAGQLSGSALDRGLATFSRIAQAQGLASWERSDVQSPARHRLYQATALQHFVLSDHDERLAVHLR